MRLPSSSSQKVRKKKKWFARSLDRNSSVFRNFSTLDAVMKWALNWPARECKRAAILNALRLMRRKETGNGIFHLVCSIGRLLNRKIAFEAVIWIDFTWLEDGKCRKSMPHVYYYLHYPPIHYWRCWSYWFYSPIYLQAYCCCCCWFRSYEKCPN